VLKGIQKGMSLPDEAVIPSFATLRDMGNTSSSTTWYTIAYLESQGMVKKGHQIMQVRGSALSSLGLMHVRLSAPMSNSTSMRAAPGKSALCCGLQLTVSCCVPDSAHI
jgi:hypothetical protein